MEEECGLYPPRCVSYLQARDPSILSWNRHGIEKVRQNLEDMFAESETPTISEEKKDEGLDVHLRIKGGILADNSLYTVENDVLICTVPENSQVARKRKDKTVVLKKYKFTNIFGPTTRQEVIFDTIIKDKVLRFINGENSTLLAYGASGSGKTFTMMGTPEQPGIIPRSLDYLFRTLAGKTSQVPTVKPLANGQIERLSESNKFDEIRDLRAILQYSQGLAERNQTVKTYNEMQRRLSNNQVGIVNMFPPIVDAWVSFAEIYNEDIYDLLRPLPGRGHQRPKLKIGGLQDDTYIRGLKYVYIRSGLEAYQILLYGLHNLSYAATAVNQHSSRSHCIFSIRLVAGNDEKNCSVSVFNLCDLAGSERLKKTLNEGDRLKESTKINTSLFVLGRCISSIRDMQQTTKDSSCGAPFRESKLTQIFQKALQGKEDIFMIVNINPSPDAFDNTQHALMFSAIAKQIVTQEPPPKVLKPSRFSSYRQNLSDHLAENYEWEDELEELRNERARLVLRVSELQQQFEIAVESERTHLHTNYGNIIQIKDSQLKELRQERDELNLAKENLERDNWLLRRRLSTKKEEEVISLSSDEESDSETSNNIRKQNEEFRKDKEELSQKISKLNQILEDANADYSKLLEEHEGVRAELAEITIKNLTLEDQISVQNEELKVLRSHTVAQSEEIEKLECHNQELLHLLGKKTSTLKRNSI